MLNYNRSSEVMTVNCDECGEEAIADGLWSECIAFLKLKSWKFYKDEFGVWTHLCPECLPRTSAEEDFL